MGSSRISLWERLAAKVRRRGVKALRGCVLLGVRVPAMGEMDNDDGKLIERLPVSSFDWRARILVPD